MDKPGAYSMTPRFTTTSSSSITPNQRNMLTRMNSSESIEIALKLSEQDAQYGTNMHDSLTAADEPEIEKLIRNGFAEHEALLEIFNRKFVRGYVPQEYKRRDPPPAARSAPPPPVRNPPPQRYAVRNNRYSRQWAIDHMNQYDVMQLTLLLSEQEAEHGVNMYDAMTYEDEMEVDALVHSGRFTADQAIRHVFDRNYPPRNSNGHHQHHQPLHRTTSAYSAPPRRDPYPHQQQPSPPLHHGGHEYRSEYDYPPPAVSDYRRSPAPSPLDSYRGGAAPIAVPPPHQHSPYSFPTTYAPSHHPQHQPHQPLSHHTQSFYREPIHYPPEHDPYYRPADPYAVPSPTGYGPPPTLQAPPSQQQHRLVAAPSIINIQQQQFEELQRAANGGNSAADERRRLEEERRRLEEDRRRFEEERRRALIQDAHNRMGATRDSSPQPRDRVYRNGGGSVAGGSVAGGSVHGGSVHGGSVRASSPTPSTGSAATASSHRRRTSFNDGSSVNNDTGSISGSKNLGERKKSIFSFLSSEGSKDKTSSNNSSPASKSMTYKEKDVKQVMELGYGRELAVAALIEANNNVKLAIQILASR